MSRFDELCFGKVKQNAVGFFNAALRVGRTTVQLHNVFSRNATRVGNGNINSVVTVGCKGLVYLFPIGFPTEIRVAKSETEGKLHYSVVTASVLVFHSVEVTLGVGGFVPLVAEVDTFLVNDVITVFGSVDVYGVVCLEVVRDGIGNATRGVDLTLQDTWDSRCARLTGDTDVQARLYAGIVLDKAALDVIAQVE